MSKIISFEDFAKKGAKVSDIAEDNLQPSEAGKEHNEQYYMFFQNLASIKHYVDEILAHNPADVDALLKNGHDWAADHISTSKDDVQEVSEWLRNELDTEAHKEVEEKPIEVDLEDNDDDENDDDDAANKDDEMADNGKEAEGEESEEDEDEEE